MSLLWIMVGLSIVACTLLILNIVVFKKARSERKSRDKAISVDKEADFQAKCLAYNLSTREIDVLRLIITGHTYKSTADLLFISEKTVDAHLRSIYSKTGVRNKVELVIKFY